MSKKKKSIRGKAQSRSANRWSNRVTRESNALDLEIGVFTRDPKEIARSLKRSALRSTRRKSDPFRSAMSMLNFYINRAGRNLSEEKKAKLNQAKIELRRVFNRKRRDANRGDG